MLWSRQLFLHEVKHLSALLVRKRIGKCEVGCFCGGITEHVLKLQDKLLRVISLGTSTLFIFVGISFRNWFVWLSLSNQRVADLTRYPLPASLLIWEDSIDWFESLRVQFPLQAFSCNDAIPSCSDF